MEVRAAFAVLLGLSLQAAAATNDFTALGPTGGAVNQIVFSTDGSTAFMAAAGGFYRSPDGGVSWKNIKPDFLNAPWDVAIDPADPTRIYVVSIDAPFLWVSSDGGATLIASTTLPAAVTQAEKIAVSHDGATLYLSSDGHLFVSTDRGGTWRERTALSTDDTTQVLRLAVDPSDPATVYATIATGTTTQAGTFVSRDGGGTWTDVAAGPEQTFLAPDLAINPANPAQVWSARYDGVWVSADHGAHWNNVLSGSMYAVALDPSNPAIVYAATGFGKVYRSANAGTSWTDVSGNVAAGGNLHLAVNPAHPTQLLASGSAGVSGTTTSGTTWALQQTGLMATSIEGLSADPSMDRIYIHSQISGVYYTRGGGTSIQAVNNAGLLALEPSQVTLDVQSILAQPGRLFASLPTGLTYSTDGGASWQPTIEPVPQPGAQPLWMMSSGPGAAQTLLATTDGPMRRSVDRGATWGGVAGQPAGSQAGTVLVAASDPLTVYGMFYLSLSPGTWLGIYKSVDAGASWTPVNNNLAASPSDLLAVDPTDARVVYGSTFSNRVTAGIHLLKSVDGGATWSSLTWDVTKSGIVPSRIAIDPLHPSILYSEGNGRIARSVDAGATWETVRSADTLPNYFANSLLADPHRPENLLVGTTSAGVQLITFAPDLTLSVSGPPSQLGIGTTASYAYTATNLGPFDATGVTVAVQLPAAAQSADATVGTGTGACSVSGTVAICRFPILRKSAGATINVSAIAATAGTFNTSASISGEQPDPDLSGNTVSSTATALTLSDLSVTATGNATATTGGTVTYTLVASNAGPNDAPATQLTFALASGLTLGTVTSTAGSCSTTTTTTTCDLGSLAASKSATVSVTATAASAGALVSTASVSSGATDPTAANNSASASTSVSAPAASGGHGGGGAMTPYEGLALLSLLLVRRGVQRCGTPADGDAGRSRWRTNVPTLMSHGAR